jgi:hypothetical protein
MCVQVARENTNKIPDSLRETLTILHNSSTLHGHQHGKMKSDVNFPNLQKYHLSTSFNQKMTATRMHTRHHHHQQLQHHKNSYKTKEHKKTKIIFKQILKNSLKKKYCKKLQLFTS